MLIYSDFIRDTLMLGNLTRLRPLNRTSLLPSSWNLDKIFALTGHLAQVHMANKKFPIFLHAGKGKRKRERSLQLSITFISISFGPKLATASIAQSTERQTMDLRFGGTNPALYTLLSQRSKIFYLFNQCCGISLIG